jgi:hypothetical protein
MMFVSDILGERGDVLFSLNRPRGQSDFDPMARRVFNECDVHACGTNADLPLWAVVTRIVSPTVNIPFEESVVAIWSRLRSVPYVYCSETGSCVCLLDGRKDSV